MRPVASNTQPAFAWHARMSPCAGCLSGGGETREFCACVRLAALVMIVLRITTWYCTGERLLSFDERRWCVVRAVSSNMQAAFAWHMRTRQCAGCLSGDGKTRKLAAHARRHALIMICLRTTEGY